MVWHAFACPNGCGKGLPTTSASRTGSSFEELRDALGDRPVDIPTMVTYGSYPRYRLLVTFFLEKKGWLIDQLLQARLTEDEATAIMRADARP